VGCADTPESGHITLADDGHPSFGDTVGSTSCHHQGSVYSYVIQQIQEHSAREESFKLKDETARALLQRDVTVLSSNIRYTSTAAVAAIIKLGPLIPHDELHSKKKEIAEYLDWFGNVVCCENRCAYILTIYLLLLILCSDMVEWCFQYLWTIPCVPFRSDDASDVLRSCVQSTGYSCECAMLPCDM